MLAGVVKFFSDEKGYGFIKRDDGGPDIFVHISDLKKSQLEGLEKDDRVSFNEADGRKGKKAVNVTMLG